MIKALSFDFYGVLYSNFDWTVINERIYSDEAKHETFRKLVDAANQGAIDNEGFRARVIKLAEDEKHPDAPAVHFMPTINTELLKFIRELKSERNLKLAILSNGGKSHVCDVLEEHHTLDAFDLIATSAELPNYKPEPAAFQYVATYFGIQNDELVHIDDSPRHIEGTHNAGVNGLLYTDFESFHEELLKLLSS